MFDLYTAPTPNGHKISVALEELGLPYNVIAVDLGRGDQRQPDYVQLNPNARIPTLVDREAGDFPIFESGAILVYLAERTGKLMPSEPKPRSEVMQWLMFQMAHTGPMMGQANVFFRYFPEKIEPVIKRYHREVKRIFGVLDRRLEGREYLCGEYSIADIAHWCWVRTHRWSGVDIDAEKNLQAWLDRIYERPAARRGIEVPNAEQRAKNVESFIENARKMLV